MSPAVQMGSVAVLSPSEARSPHDTRNMIHPFFTESKPAPKPAPDEAASGADNAKATVSTDGGNSPQMPIEQDEADKEDEKAVESGPNRKRRKVAAHIDEDDVEEGKEKATKKRRKPAKAAAGGSIADHFKRLDSPLTVSSSAEASITGDAAANDDHVTTEVAAETASATAPEPVAAANEAAIVPSKEPDVVLEETNLSRPSTPKPKKLLQLNMKAGTIGSPPKPKKPATEGAEPKSSPKRGRPKKRRIVVIRYSQDQESRKRIAERVEAILSGPRTMQPAAEESTQSPAAATTPKKKKAPKAANNAHTFFAGKLRKPDDGVIANGAAEADGAKPNPPSKSLKRQRIFTSTPISPQKPRVIASGKAASALMVDRFAFKIPGAQRPAWPWKDACHIRGYNQAMEQATALPESGEPLVLAHRKSKGNAIYLLPREDLLKRLAYTLHVPDVLKEIRKGNSDTFEAPPPALRLPKKLVESGHKLMQRVQPLLRSVRKADHDLAESELDDFTREHVPPQLRRLFALAPKTLSAYDQSQCETMCWTQKYAPTTADEVIQPGREVRMLKQWLERLMVQAVDMGAVGGGKSIKDKSAAPKKGRKRKKLDGFIISSDEEDNEMGEVSDGELDVTPNGSQKGVRRTVIRSGDRIGKGSKDGAPVTNAIVISGPHGCGKTAAVYAVAKELGFDVFEINSSSRRAGKDVLEKIGDMTRNHHVQHTDSPKDEAQIVAEDVAKEVASGKQKVMDAFFKAKPTAKEPAKTKNVIKKAAVSPPDAKKNAAKPQKQSLILLDEADILYEEDKQFWSTVITIMTQSKRPFIITCNDESLIPLSTLSLHAILRLSRPQADLAIDRMLLIAACEGHALQRNAVEALYDFRGGDLRAALMDLNYWCQIGVGDRRGGFDWFVLRWPRGVDLDDDGQTLRVISQRTYQKGMGFIDHDAMRRVKQVIVHEEEERDEELLRQAWDSCGVDLGDWHQSLPTLDWLEGASAAEDMYVKGYDAFAETMSAADLISGATFASPHYEELDWSLPDMLPKTRADFTEGMALLDARPRTHHDSLNAAIAASIRTWAKPALDTSFGVIGGPNTMPKLTETIALKHMQQHCSKASSPSSLAISDFHHAFNPLTTTDDATYSSATFTSNTSSILLTSTLPTLAAEIAPYIRSIVLYDQRLSIQRLKLSNLLSQGGRPNKNKKMRTTRSAFSAMEGGERKATRGERWFKAELNSYWVERTAGGSWGMIGDGWGEAEVAERAAVDGEDEKTGLDGIEGRKKTNGSRKRIVDSSEDELVEIPGKGED